MAKKTISQRISFDGAEEMEAALESIGQAWERLSKNMAKGAKDFQGPGKKLSDRVVRLKKDFERLRTAAQRVGDSFRTLGKRAEEVGSVIATVTRRMALLATAATGAAAALAAVARSGAKAADAAAKSAEGLGLTVEQYTALKFAAAQSGVSVGQFESALGALNTRVAAAAAASSNLNSELGLHPEQWAEAQRAAVTGADAFGKAAKSGNKAAEALRLLGIKTLDAGLAFRPAKRSLQEFQLGLKNTGPAVRPTFDLLLEIADGFAALPDGINKAGIAAALFGEGLGRFMLPFLNRGSAGIRELLGDAKRLGATFTEEQAKIGTALISAQGRLGVALKGLKDQLGLLFAPALTKAADRQTKALIRHRNAILGITSGVVPKAVALVEDLVAALSGRDEDVREPFILKARDAIIAFARDVRAAFVGIIVPAFKGLLAIFDEIAVGVNAAFGTDFSGRTLLIAAAVAQLLGVFSSLGTVVLAVSALLLGVLPEAVALFKDLAAAVQGRDQDVQAAWIIEARDAVVAFGQAVREAFEQIIVPAFKKLLAGADKVAGAINKLFGTDFSGASLLIVAAVAQFLGLFRSIAAVFVIVVSVVSLAKTAILIISGIAKFLILTIGGIPALIAAAVVLAIAAIVLFWDDIKAGAQDAWDFVTGLWDGLVDFFAGIGEAAADALVSAFRGAVDTIGGLLKGLAKLAARAFKAAKSALSFSGGGGAGNAPVPLLSGGGGPLRGPGSKTSDSIWARLSRGEFVVRAKAVEHYGPGLLSAINAMALPKGTLPRFALGGLVDGINRSLMGLMPVPAYAGGGGVPAEALAQAGGRPIILQLGDREFRMTADEETAESLGRFALRQERSRIGKPPRRL